MKVIPAEPLDLMIGPNPGVPILRWKSTQAHLACSAIQCRTVSFAGNVPSTFYGNETLNPLIDSGTMIIPLPGGARVDIRDGETTYVLTDHPESARVALRADNTVSGKIEYTPFGESRETGDAQIVRSYTGKVFEPETGTYDFHTRQYDPVTGRFTSVAAGISKDDVARLIVGEVDLPAGFVQELISSPWDVDKMDYLLRDSHSCGVQYGTFDIGRILNTLALDAEAEAGSLKLTIDEGGFHALEAFVLARYYMFTQIYFHDVRRAFDLVLTDFISELLNDQYDSGRYPGVDDINEYLKCDDNRVFYEANRRSDAANKNLAWRIINRQHPKAVYETEHSPDSGLARRVERGLRQTAQNRFPGLQFWIDKAIDHPDRFRVEDTMVRFPGNPPDWREFRRESQPLQGLKEIGKFRLYADVRGDQALEDEVRDFCRKSMA